LMAEMTKLVSSIRLDEATLRSAKKMSMA
jgi:hypothetical protein